MRVDGNPIDFVLCIGDDVTDELMFDQLKKMVAHEELPRNKVFTCTVGQKPSKAEFFIDDYTDVLALLKSLKVVATKSNRNYSLSDMQSFVQDTRPFFLSSSHGVSKSATSASVMPKFSSRHGLQTHLTPVIEDQIVSKWLSCLRQLGVVAILFGLLRWRSGVKTPRENKLLRYFVASLGIACSIQRVRSKLRK
ncbi:unnamed protein product [Peronospora destructor]|uniref:Trehalose 6-phosphate phosphatase n=1 Tax=Peronospora destructor TaxID=86335 RepID=A0AAV0TLR9_9STRA|nr:unnamed protein product [Peronospora destructor]